MRETDTWSAGMVDAYSDVLDWYDVACRPEFSFSNADAELKQIIVETGADLETSRLFDSPEHLEMVCRLERDCGYMDKLCLISSQLHFAVVEQDDPINEILRDVNGRVLATPLAFVFKKHRYTGETVPMLVSLTEVDSYDSVESQTIELLTPLDGIHVQLHAPFLN